MALKLTSRSLLLAGGLTVCGAAPSLWSASPAQTGAVPPPAVAAADPGATKPTAEALRIELALLEDPATFPCDLRARASATNIVLSGMVPNEDVRRQALALARKQTTVPVQDGLAVHTEFTARVAKQKPEVLARAALDLLPGVLGAQADKIIVKSDVYGRLILQGDVGSLEDKHAVSKACRQLPGCICVVNRIRVSESAKLDPYARPEPKVEVHSTVIAGADVVSPYSGWTPHKTGTETCNAKGACSVGTTAAASRLQPVPGTKTAEAIQPKTESPARPFLGGIFGGKQATQTQSPTTSPAPTPATTVAAPRPRPEPTPALNPAAIVRPTPSTPIVPTTSEIVPVSAAAPLASATDLTLPPQFKPAAREPAGEPRTWVLEPGTHLVEIHEVTSGSISFATEESGAVSVDLLKKRIEQACSPLGRDVQIVVKSNASPTPPISPMSIDLFLKARKQEDGKQLETIIKGMSELGPIKVHCVILIEP